MRPPLSVPPHRPVRLETADKASADGFGASTVSALSSVVREGLPTRTAWFTSTGMDTRFTRPSGMAYTIELFTYWTSLDNLSTHFFFLWDNGVGNRVMELGFSGSSGNLRLRMGDDFEVLSGTLAANTLWYIQLTITGNTYYLDAGAVPGDGTTTQKATGTASISNTAGTSNFRVARHFNPDATATLGGLWISPLRVTRGVARARGSVPTAAFPTF